MTKRLLWTVPVRKQCTNAPTRVRFGRLPLLLTLFRRSRNRVLTRCIRTSVRPFSLPPPTSVCHRHTHPQTPKCDPPPPTLFDLLLLLLWHVLSVCKQRAGCMRACKWRARHVLPLPCFPSVLASNLAARNVRDRGTRAAAGDVPDWLETCAIADVSMVPQAWVRQMDRELLLCQPHHKHTL